MNPIVEAVVRTDTPSTLEPADVESLNYALKLIKIEYIRDRMKGTHGRSPMSQEKAEESWNRVELNFSNYLKMAGNKDPYVARRLGFGKKPTPALPSSSDYSNPDPAEGDDTDWEAHEKAWQGESRARRLIKGAINL